jgi:hypothetical protein
VEKYGFKALTEMGYGRQGRDYLGGDRDIIPLCRAFGYAAQEVIFLPQGSCGVAASIV